YHNVQPEDMKWILVEASGRILPEVGADMGRYRPDRGGARTGLPLPRRRGRGRLTATGARTDRDRRDG
ncbi:hypothetical protein ACWEQ8_40520, partial [Streptomyces noursei]